ncbi:MAG: DMT family transporter [Bacteroidetes bacterium]|nr:DMT family transporter [Bacteroidota bacterium]
MTNANTSPHNAQNWLLLAALTFIWGTSYILIKKGLIAFSAVELACLRISVSFLFSLPFLPKALKQVPKEKYLTVLQIGIFGSGAPAFLFAISMTHSGSAINGILNSLSPLWTLIIGYYIFKVNITAQKAIGVVIGFAGALVLVLGKGGAIQVDVLYNLLPIIATFCYGMSSNLTKQYLQNLSPIYTTSLAMSMIGAPMLAGLLLFTDAPAQIISGTAWPSVAAVLALSLFGTLIAWMLFYKLVQRTDALFAASVTYLIPIVALAWGMLDGETLTLYQLSGFGLIMLGVYFTTRQKV